MYFSCIIRYIEVLKKKNLVPHFYTNLLCTMLSLFYPFSSLPLPSFMSSLYAVTSWQSNKRPPSYYCQCATHCARILNWGLHDFFTLFSSPTTTRIINACFMYSLSTLLRPRTFAIPSSYPAMATPPFCCQTLMICFTCSRANATHLSHRSKNIK